MLGQNESSPFDQACFVIALQVVAELQQKAEFIEKQAMDLAIVRNPGLVDQEGNPLSSRAKRKIEKEASETVPTFGPVANPEE